MPLHLEQSAELDIDGLQAAAPKQSSATLFRLALPGILAALVCLLPFINKAWTSDDEMFVLSARQILQSPLQPMSFERCWYPLEPCGTIVALVGAGSAQSLLGYLLVPVVLAGGMEWVANVLGIG